MLMHVYIYHQMNLIFAPLTQITNMFKLNLLSERDMKQVISWQQKYNEDKFKKKETNTIF